MALSTHSKFYYGLKVTPISCSIDFAEGSNVFTATLTVGSYTGAKLATEIKKQMEMVGNFTYDVNYDRITRKFSITSSSIFQLLTSTGPANSSSAWDILGFSTLTDKTGSLNYNGDYTSGNEISTQFHLQSHKPTNQNKKAIDGVINKSSSGVVEVVKFGNERFMSCEFAFITNIIQGCGSVIRTRQNGVDDFLDFMDWLTEKYLVEFMVDENHPENYQTFILESTEQDSKGLDFDLIELYDKSLPEYFRSGILKFRLME